MEIIYIRVSIAGMLFQMPKKKRKPIYENGDKSRVLEMFAEYARANVIDTNWQNIDNSVYLELSNRSGKPKNVIRNIIRKIQPSLNLQKHRYI